MSDERFFTQVKSALHDYSPEVASEVYSAMRRRLWWSNFTRLSFARFNMLYLLLLLATGSTATLWFSDQSAKAERSAIYTQPEQPAVVDNEQPVPNVLVTANESVAGKNSTCASHTSCCSATRSTCTASQNAEAKGHRLLESVQASTATNSELEGTTPEESTIIETSAELTPVEQDGTDAVADGETKVDQTENKVRKGKKWTVRIPSTGTN